MVMLHLKFTDKGENRNFIRFITVGIVTAILYLPWLPYVLKSGGDDHWMSLPHPGSFSIISLVIKSKPDAFYISHYHRYYNYYFSQFNAPGIVTDVSGLKAEDVLKNEKEVIVLHAHQDNSFTTMQIYSDWAKELNNFTKVREFRIKGNDSEYGDYIPT